MTTTATAPAWRIARTDVVTAASPRSGRSVRGRRARTALAVGLVVFVVVQVASHRAIESDAVPLRDPIYAEKVGLLKGHPEFWVGSLSPPLHAGEGAGGRGLVNLPPSAPPPWEGRGEKRQNGVGSRKTLLAVGSSRTQLNLDAARLSDDRLSVFNFGCAGCGPVTDALYLRRLFDDGMTCDAALVELHPAMLADMTPPFEARWLHDYRLHRYEVNTLRGYGWPIDTPTQFRPEGPLQTAHTFRFAALNAYAPSLLPCPFGLGLLNRTDPRGHVTGIPVGPAERPKYVAQAYAEYLDSFADYRPGGPAVAAVRDMLTQLKQRGIRSTLILSPESSEFRGWYGAGRQEVISRFAADLAREFDAPLIDTREWLPDAEFADGHHATPAGAVTFTERLRGALK